MAVFGSGENLPFIILMGTILCDVLINLLCNDISNTVQQSSFTVTRSIPYLIWFTLTVFWVVFKRGTGHVSNLRKYEPFIVFVGTVLCDVLINLLCSDISVELQQQSFAGERFLPYVVLFATALLWFVLRRTMETRESKTQQASTPHGVFQLNDSVWEFHPPSDGIPEMDILFFHGLLPADDSKDTFWKTWLARDTDQVLWPKEWLGKTYPNARIMAISYHHSFATNGALERHGEHDMDALERSLVKDIILAKHLNIGQNCPVVLIGHCLGGIVIKELLLAAVNLKRTVIPPIANRVNTFLENVRGVFSYAIPHERSRIEELAELVPSKNSTLELLKAVAKRRVEIQEEFNRQERTEFRARSFAVLEGRQTKYLGFHDMVVGEASPVRYEVNRSYIDTTADHFCVCRPTNMEARTYTILVQFLASALADGMMRQYAGLVLRRFRINVASGG